MRFLVISDIHYGDLAQMEGLGKSEPASRDAMGEIARNVKDALVDQNCFPEYLLVLGDITSRGSPGEFREVSFFISILANELGITENNIVLTYGNHDVDWEICKLVQTPPERKQAYCEVAANIGPMYTPETSFSSDGPVVGSGILHKDGLDFIVLNSGIVCYDDQTVRNGSLALEQYDWLENTVPGLLRDDTTKILILHHHLLPLPYSRPIQDLSPLREGASVLQIIGNLGVHMVLHGHRHHPIIFTETQTGWQAPVTFLCAGSFGVCSSERAQGCIPNTMHFLEVMSADRCRHEGRVVSFELDENEKWNSVRENSASFSLNPVQWFGSPAGIQASETIVQQVLDTLTATFNPGDHKSLPLYEDLELPLRCLKHLTLNEIFSKLAMSMGYTITGKYPEPCLITETV